MNPETPSNQPQKRQIKLQIPPDLNAIYCNMAILSSTKNEMIFDFAQMLPPDKRTKVQSRVVMTPQHAKLLMHSLQRNIERYEAQHGEIPVNIPPSLAEQLFDGIQPENDDDDE